jgi:multimeric flavodoxin WrbA
MRAYILSDGEFSTNRLTMLDEIVSESLAKRGFEITRKSIAREELQFCRGCFDCWTKTPGECAMKDGIAEINRACMTSDVVVYLCPIVFGQFSANMKSAIDRWLPNMLPFFQTRKDGSTMHPPRYESYPKQIMIGYAEHLSENDAQLFVDITQKHRNNVTILIDRGNDAELSDALYAVSLDRVGGSL